MTTLFILNDAPYGSERSYNDLRLVKALSKTAHPVRVFLMGDAVACAASGQKVPSGYYNAGDMVRTVGGEVGLVRHLHGRARARRPGPCGGCPPGHPGRSRRLDGASRQGPRVLTAGRMTSTSSRAATPAWTRNVPLLAASQSLVIFRVVRPRTFPARLRQERRLFVSAHALDYSARNLM